MATAAIAGLGVTPQGRDLNLSGRVLREQALSMALTDAGLDRSDIDGYIAAGSLDLAEDLRYMGIGPSFCWMLQVGGASAAASIVAAAALIEAGLARHVACVYGTAPVFRAVQWGSYTYGYPSLYGLSGPIMAHALHASRHMSTYGTTTAQLGAVAVTQRNYARTRPGTLGYGKPITLEDHHRSPMIASPLRRLDCCRDTDGGVAVIVTDDRRAADLASVPVRLLGSGMGQNVRNWHAGTAFDVHDDIAPAAQQAFRQAQLGVEDVDIAELYDPFTISVLMQLEAYGFCQPGEAGAFVEDGQTGPDGSIPTNTGGGQLSAYYAIGFTPIVEAITQLRGDAESGQLSDPRVALVSNHGGNAGVQNTWSHVTLLLGRDR